jgi:16S rRNA processing protein RimM
MAIHDFGAGDILELQQEGKRETVMLPFSTDTVPVVDIAGGRIVVDPPVGVFKD